MTTSTRTHGATGAILLAGGRASRLGGLDKPLLQRAGRSLLQRAVDAVAGSAPLTIAGPERPGIVRASGESAVKWVREEPPFSGPAAALVAVLDSWRSSDRPSADPSWAFVLATDLADPRAAVDALRDARNALAPGERARRCGLCLADHDGHPQWLAGLYRTTALCRAAKAAPDAAAGLSMRALLAPLDPLVLVASERATADVDTWDDLAREGIQPPTTTTLPSETNP